MVEWPFNGLTADGTEFPFYSVLRVSGRPRDIKKEETFVVSQISEEIILGCPF